MTISLMRLLGAPVEIRARRLARVFLDQTRRAFEDFEKVVELDPQSTFAQLARVMMSGSGPR